MNWKDLNVGDWVNYFVVNPDEIVDVNCKVIEKDDDHILISNDDLSIWIDDFDDATLTLLIKTSHDTLV